MRKLATKFELMQGVSDEISYIRTGINSMNPRKYALDRDSIHAALILIREGRKILKIKENG